MTCEICLQDVPCDHVKTTRRLSMIEEAEIDMALRTIPSEPQPKGQIADEVPE